MCLSKLASLCVLNLSKNYLSGTLISKIYVKLSFAMFCYFFDRLIVLHCLGDIPEIFHGFPSLVELNLSHNKFEGI